MKNIGSEPLKKYALNPNSTSDLLSQNPQNDWFESLITIPGIPLLEYHVLLIR